MVSSGYWAQFKKHPTDKFICDECMFKNKKYIQIFHSDSGITDFDV